MGPSSAPSRSANRYCYVDAVRDASTLLQGERAELELQSGQSGRHDLHYVPVADGVQRTDVDQGEVGVVVDGYEEQGAQPMRRSPPDVERLGAACPDRIVFRGQVEVVPKIQGRAPYDVTGGVLVSLIADHDIVIAVP